jgi:hypothetical protein
MSCIEKQCEFFFFFFVFFFFYTDVTVLHLATSLCRILFIILFVILAFLMFKNILRLNEAQ